MNEDDDDSPTNYDELIGAGDDGVVPGERRVAVVPDTANMPAQQAPLRRVDPTEEVVEIRDVAPVSREGDSVEIMRSLMKQMIEQQASTMEANQKAMEQNVKCIETLSVVMAEKTKGEKRSREETAEERLNGEDPVMIDFKAMDVGEGKDDAHNTVCWAIRRSWRMINLDPRDVWRNAGEGKGWPVRAEPNLAGQVFLEHLVPSLVGDKALAWLHDGSRTPELRTFLHANSRARSKKAQRTEVMARSADDGTGGMTIDTFITWAEAGTMKEIVEGVLNYTAALYMIRPWDYSGLVMLRCLHDVGYFAITSRNAKEQRDLAMEFVEEAFMLNSWQLAKGQHPIVLKEAMKLASAKVARKNGMANNLMAQSDIYGLHREVREKEAEVKRLKEEVGKLKKQLQEEKNRNGKKTYGEHQARKNGRPLDMEEGSKVTRKVKPSEEFYEARRRTCLFFNKGDCREGDTCTRGDHSCSAQVGARMCGSTAHSRPNHV